MSNYQSSKDSAKVKKYWAFISYRHTDNKEMDRDWASWLHKTIETYEVPAELIGTENDRGDEIPDRIYPVFRDEESLPADSDLANSITNALDNSKFLVALCSPRAVESKYVAQEIKHFKTTGKGDRIIAGIIAGEPGHKEHECFPEPLREIVNKDGKLSEPIAADFRLLDGTEGFTSAEAYKKELLKTLSKKEANKLAYKYDDRLQLMKLKIIAGILGVPLETIRDRDKAYQLAKQKKRAQQLRNWLVSVSILALASIIATYTAIHHKTLAENAQELEVTARLKTEEALLESRLNEGKIWLERARLAAKKQDYFSASMMAGRALGYEKYGRTAEDETFPILIGKQHPELLDNARSELKSYIQRTRFPLWRTPGSKATFNFDGSQVVLVNTRGNIEVRDTKTGQINGTFTVKGEVTELTFNPTGKTICAVYKNTGYSIIDLASGKALDIPKPIDCIAFSPDGKMIAVADEVNIQLLDLINKTIITTSEKIHEDTVTLLSFSPDGGTVISSSSSLRVIWNITNTIVKRAEFSGHSMSSPEIYFNPEGTQVICCSAKKSVDVFSLKDGSYVKTIYQKTTPGFITSIATDPRASLLAINTELLTLGSTDTGIMLVDIASSQEIGTRLEGHQSHIRHLDFSGDGHSLVSSGEDGYCCLWNIKMIQPVSRKFDGLHSAGVKFIFNSNGNSFTLLQSPELHESIGVDHHEQSMIDLVTGYPIFKKIATIQSLKNFVGKHSATYSCTQNESHTASLENDYVVVVRHKRSLKKDQVSFPNTNITSIAINHDGTQVATLSLDGIIQVKAVSTDKLLFPPIKAHSTSLTSHLVYSPSRNLLGSVIGTSIDTPEEHIENLVVDGIEVVKLWDTDTGLPFCSPLVGHSKPVISMEFSPTGNTLLTSSLDASIRSWVIHDTPSIDLFCYLKQDWYELKSDKVSIISSNAQETFITKAVKPLNWSPNNPIQESSPDHYNQIINALKANNWHLAIKLYELHEASLSKKQKLVYLQSMIATATHDWVTSNPYRSKVIFEALKKTSTNELLASGELEPALITLVTCVINVKSHSERLRYLPIVIDVIKSRKWDDTILKILIKKINTSAGSIELPAHEILEITYPIEELLK